MQQAFDSMKRRMEEAEARESTLRAKMEELLQCPVCLTVPAGSEVLQCHNGHIMCQGCANRTYTCPVCRTGLSQAQRYVKRLLFYITDSITFIQEAHTGSSKKPC